MSAVNKFIDTLKNEGLYKTLLKIIRYPLSQKKKAEKDRRAKKFKKMLTDTNCHEERFNWIYENNHWGCEESVSGPGSTLSATKNLRENLPKLITDFSISKIFDAPCGDFSWMKELLKTVKAEYTGGDIVKSMINELNSEYSNPKTRFIYIDLIKNNFPQADLMICRDLLFHLSYKDTKAILQNFLDSNIKYLLTTTHYNLDNFKNKDITTGGYRGIDLFSKPYNFPDNPLSRIEDWIPPYSKREMCLWDRSQIKDALNKSNL